MNRVLNRALVVGNCVPHARGDEPHSLEQLIQTKIVFPTPVGMNRIGCATLKDMIGVPHARGDEPGLVLN